MSQNPKARAFTVGTSLSLATVAGIYFGSGMLEHFDPALFWYAVASVLAAYAVGYRFTLWASRPPSRMYFKRGMQMIFGGGPKYKSNNAPSAAGEIAKSAATNFAAQNFIRERSYFRWIMHLCLSGGCTLAFAVTFPLVFGWLHFTTAPDNAEIYNVVAFGVTVRTFSIHSIEATLAFNALNISAVFVLIGLFMAGYRRLTDAGERATQTFYEDILPLILIAAVTVTGIALTISYKFFDGLYHGSMVWVHLLSVVALIFYIPFGKLFHMFQRTCALCVTAYKKKGAKEEQATCLVTGEEFASQRHVDDLKIVLDELGLNYRFTTEDGKEVHYQDISPQGRRRLIALNQGKLLKR
ncbi:hypothetical protein [Pelagicoccus mobilis]|uniref:Uncharacterized protein n=1 Tax=Pelagicoccus mobilis TaxID=415221 RepID=A0A934VR84_9BACT|nr:hypothetical protein [Pelagicoccus mobilis]MBK1877358.1 hypothetical protein [Pelagicoccus mobilis]